MRNGFVARHSVAGRLLHRILVLRHLTEGESSPDEKELERLGFITGAKGDLNQILSTLKTRLSQYGVAGSIVIDEVQDMTPAEALLITLLCDFDEADAHRVMLAGDEFQTLNGNDFSWGTWVTRSHDLAKILLDKIGQVNKEAAHGWHPLKAFTHLKEIDLPPHITQIQRNHPDIAEFFKQAWDWEMAPGRESNDAMKEAKALEKSGDNDSDLEPSEPVVGIFVQTDSHGLDTVSLIANWLKNLGDLGNVAIIVPDNGLRAELVMMIDDSELFLYDPFTIKGLEQDIVIVIGGYGVSNASEFSVLLNVKPENWTKEHHALFDRINRHMLVANSRAKQTHLSVYFEQDAARPISLKHNFTWRQFSLPDSIRYGHDEGSIPTWNLNDVASRLQTENRSRTWFLRSFHQLAQQFNRSQEDDRFAEQIERVQNAWWAKAQASVKSLETEDYESDPLLKLLISIDPEAKVRPNQPAPQLLALFLNQEKTFVDDAFGRALAEAQSLKDAIEEQMKSNLTNTEHFLEFIKKNRGKGLIPFSKVNDYVVLNKLLQNRRLETQRAKQNNRELQNALPKNISGWEVEEPRLKQDVAEMIDERICQVAADFDLMLGEKLMTSLSPLG